MVITWYVSEFNQPEMTIHDRKRLNPIILFLFYTHEHVGSKWINFWIVQSKIVLEHDWIWRTSKIWQKRMWLLTVDTEPTFIAADIEGMELD